MTIDAHAMKNLAAVFRGELVAPGDEAYDELRTIYNAMIDRRPALIARCADVADVIAAVEFAREQKLDIAVRSGGHNGPGLCLVDDGLVVDLSGLRGIRVDPESRTAQVEAGCRWGDVDHAAHPFGLAAVSGVISTTGVGGLTLGGGHGYLTRKYGLTIDNLLSADVVLADGRLVHASETEHPDLFWAIRGGGGNFGIVTSFEFRLHPVKNVIGGPLFWDISDLEPALRWYREWLPNAPDDVYAFFLEAEVPPAPPFPEPLHSRKVCGLMWCCTGSREQADEAVAAARRVADPLFEHVGPIPYPMLQSLHDELYCPGLQWYWKGDFVRELTDAAIAEHERFGEVPTTHSTMHLYPINGAVHRKRSEETAWPHRDANWSMVIAGVAADPTDNDRMKSWARGYWEALHPHSAGAAYVNFMMEEGDDRVRATYGPNHRRLGRVKAEYDPENLFHVNQNIAPAAGG
jgi:FAD/FMN-containing dehydrogenase